MAKRIQESPKKRHIRIPTSQPFSLLQEMNRIKIDLSNTCTEQSYFQAKQANLPGNKFVFSVPSPKPNEVRIAIAGDSTAQGFGGTTMEEIEAVAKKQRLSDQTDGTQQGMQGWPYLLHQLLKKNNETVDYTFMNYGV
jgi:hypothetical protein